MFQEIHRTFMEDWEVLETQQRWNDLTARSPVINIQGDAGPIHARRIIERMLSEEELHLRRQAG
jgi:hypothetical protein